ncbi:MAG TPA: hypothetical protein VFH90_11275 [Candidatus Limnocylindria bacterium]|nr:hypothetical protein [Candidatus Limnocylindria bacterium]
MAADPSPADAVAAEATPADARRAAWIATAFGVWIVCGLLLVLWAIQSGRSPDPAASVYHIPFYLGLAALGAFAIGRLVRAIRRGAGWRQAFPPGYGSLGAGLLAGLAALILDVGWREGVGIGFGIEGVFAPSRILVAVAVVLIAITPLRAALQLGAVAVPRVAVVLSGALALAAVSWVGGFQPAQSPWMERSGQFAWGNSEIWVMEADGSRQTRLVEEADPEVGLGYASWSPDGSRIGYSRFTIPDADNARSDAAVWTVNPDGTDARMVVDGEGMQWIPRFSPDGAWVAYTQDPIGGPWVNSGPVGPGLGAGPGGGGAAGPLTVPTPNADIWRVAANGGGSPERLTDSPGDDRAPVYSPDGSQILFDSTRDGNTEIYVMDAEGGNQRRLTNDPADDWGATWSPDGTFIAFNSFRNGLFDIWIMHADGSGLRQVTMGSPGDGRVAPSWSPDGSRIAYTYRLDDRPGEIWSVEAAGGDELNLSRSPQSADEMWTGGWGPDGRIVFSRGIANIAETSGLVRQDLGVAAMLLSVLVAAAVVVAVARTGPPFGSFTLLMGIGMILVAAPIEAWRFIPVGVVTGLVADIATYAGPARWRSRIAGAAASGAFVLATAGVVLATTGLGWTPTLLLGVATAAAALGWGVGALGDSSAATGAGSGDA